MKLISEVIAYNIESALNAQLGGADRIELCDNPGDGGTTTSFGTIKMVREAVDIDLFVMIRPRGGDFCYSDLEFEAMKEDIKRAKEIGADGVVLGILSPDGKIDEERCRTLIKLAQPMQVTCHRAFDMTRDPLEALQSCINIGFGRILTSGQKAQARKGTTLIKQLVDTAGSQLSIMAGCGVNESTVKDIISQTGVHEIHFSAHGTRQSAMQFKNAAISGMGSTQNQEYQVSTVSTARVKEIRKRAQKAFLS